MENEFVKINGQYVKLFLTVKATIGDETFIGYFAPLETEDGYRLMVPARRGWIRAERPERQADL